MKKGYKVRVLAEVMGTTDGNRRKIRRYEVPPHITKTGIVIGRSFLKTGKIKIGQYYDEPNYLDVEEQHPVIVVEPLEQHNSWLNSDKPLFQTERYLKPIRCLEEDLELIGE